MKSIMRTYFPSAAVALILRHTKTEKRPAGALRFRINGASWTMASEVGEPVSVEPVVVQV